MAVEKPESFQMRLSRLHAKKRKRRDSEQSKEGRDLVSWLKSLPKDAVITFERPEK